MDRDKVVGPSHLRNMNSFRDILEERRHTSDVMWITRDWEPVRTVADAQATNPLNIRKAVLNSLRLKDTIKQVTPQSDHMLVLCECK